MNLLPEEPRRRSAVENQSAEMGAREVAGWGFWSRFLTVFLRALSIAGA
jgi:hypothetical protein